MIASILHLAVAVVLAGLTAVAARMWTRHHRSYTLLVVAVAAGLTYDNTVLGLGRWLGHGSTLEALSLPRFVWHALATPLLVIVGFGAARAFGAGWARGRAAHAAACTLATTLVGWGVVTDVVRLETETQADGGIVSYGNAAAGLPVPAIATIVVLIAFGAAVWRTASWPWLAAGAALMFVASGLGSVSGLITNVGELALISSLVATEHRITTTSASADRHPAARSRRTAPRRARATGVASYG